MEENTTVSLGNPDEIFQKNKDKWYETSTEYWKKQEKNDYGMLGGFVSVSGHDILSSRDIIEKYQKKHKLGNNKCVDCGAGVGRVAELCLSDFFKSIDLVDPVSDFLDEAEKKLKNSVEIRKITLGIQDWIPDCKYDLIWAQWSIMYLTDMDAILFLKRCKESLNLNGLIMIKDNISSHNINDEKDKAQYFHEDNGICRSYNHYIELFQKSDLKLIEAEKQIHYPKNLLPLYTFVLK